MWKVHGELCVKHGRLEQNTQPTRDLWSRLTETSKLLAHLQSNPNIADITTIPNAYLLSKERRESLARFAEKVIEGAIAATGLILNAGLIYVTYMQRSLHGTCNILISLNALSNLLYNAGFMFWCAYMVLGYLSILASIADAPILYIFSGEYKKAFSQQFCLSSSKTETQSNFTTVTQARRQTTNA
uniref:Uncharacterized protein n=1 Tax=Ditylenchus dipsaci TaxID=166011 RepID=A0A915DHB4_9BILA